MAAANGVNHVIVINLGIGDLHSGCANVIAQVSTQGQYSMQYVGSLPPAPELEQLYRRWQLLYREFYRSHSANLSATRAITISTSGVTHFSSVEFGDLAQQLRRRLNHWLNAESFHAIDRKLSRLFDPTDPIRVTIQTNDPVLRRLPWHLWNFFEDFPLAEVTLSVAEYERVAARSQGRDRVRILAVLGDSRQIDLQSDRRAIEALPNADAVFLTEPSYAELHEHLWDERGWDILFFAGHSQTESQLQSFADSQTGIETGRIYINAQESLTLDQVRNALKRAIQRGLKLAIFNSCDGLGLAQALADLHIPQVVVMRELVPDAVAQAFFREFLLRFAEGHSLYASVREAREKLEQLEDEYPCATWLPLICQNPAEEPMVWQAQPPASPPRRLPWSHLAIASLIITIGTLGLRSLGSLQNLELQAFDRMMQLRPAESIDSRLLLVTITEADVQMQDAQERRGASVSDRTLAQLLAKLRPHQPRVVGLDIYRDAPIDPATQLPAQLQQMPQFVAVCEVGDGSGTQPMTGIPPERVSFSDVPVDGDGVVRRQILGMAIAPGTCATDVSFSLRLAQLYLESEQIAIARDDAGQIKIGDRTFPQLLSNSGSYHQLDAMGYQIMLNYRANKTPATQVTLGEILNKIPESQLAELVRDRIVIIGTVAPSFKDYFFTPYSQGDTLQAMPGVVLQAHMTSQLVSAVLDQRPLIQSLPIWGVVLWIWGWALGGSLAFCVRFPFREALPTGWGLGGAMILLGLASYGALGLGWWLPLVPAAIALVAGGGAVYGLKRVGLTGSKSFLLAGDRH
jgi:CHASE2 domain-containing sensor protein